MYEIKEFTVIHFTSAKRGTPRVNRGDKVFRISCNHPTMGELHFIHQYLDGDMARDVLQTLKNKRGSKAPAKREINWGNWKKPDAEGFSSTAAKLKSNALAKVKANKPKPATMYFRRDRDMFRVWNENWSGDTFEVMTEEEFNAAKVFFLKFSIPLREAEED